MSKTKKEVVDVEPIDPFEGFNNITNQIIPGLGTEKNENITKQDVDEILDEPEKPIAKEKRTSKNLKKVEDDDSEDSDLDDIEDSRPGGKTKLNDKPDIDDEEDDSEAEEKEAVSKTKKETVEDVSDEAELIEPFVDLLDEEFGWNLEEDEKPKSVQELKDFMQEVIEANSQPQYSNELSARFDRYLANGGDPEKFMEKNFGEIDYEKVDIKKEDNQKRVLRDYYKKKGFSESKIDKYLERLETSDELESESKDALQELTDLQKKERVALEQNQERQRLQQIEDHRKFIASTEAHLQKIDDIHGIRITRKEKEEILPYIFQMGRDGKTQQQKDYESNPVEYLITTAYLYKHREDLKKKLENGNLTSAAEKFKQKQKELKAKQKLTKSDFPDETDDSEDWLKSIVGGITKSNK